MNLSHKEITYLKKRTLNWKVMYMKMLEKFEYEGKIYEIKLIETQDGFTVRAYCQDKKANRFSYSIDKETNEDFTRIHGRGALKELIQHAKSDIIGN